MILVHAAQQLGDFERDYNQRRAAEIHYRRAVEVGRQAPKSSPLRDYHAMNSLPRAKVALADLLTQDGRCAEALGLYRSAGNFLRPGMLLAQQSSTLSSTYSRAVKGVLSCLEHLAKEGQPDEARKYCEELTTSAFGDPERESPMHPQDVANDAPLDEAREIRQDHTYPGRSDLPKITLQLLAAKAWGAIGDIEKSQKLYEEVMREFRQTVRRLRQTSDEDERVAWARAAYLLGDEEFHRGNLDRALPLLDIAIEGNPADSESLDHRGQCRTLAGTGWPRDQDQVQLLHQGRRQDLSAPAVPGDHPVW
jgi:tetratricopeptide (TPR) repeat protein